MEWYLRLPKPIQFSLFWLGVFILLPIGLGILYCLKGLFLDVGILYIGSVAAVKVFAWVFIPANMVFIWVYNRCHGGLRRVNAEQLFDRWPDEFTLDLIEARCVERFKEAMTCYHPGTPVVKVRCWCKLRQCQILFTDTDRSSWSRVGEDLVRRLQTKGFEVSMEFPSFLFRDQDDQDPRICLRRSVPLLP